MITETDIQSFRENKPFSYIFKDNFLQEEKALKIQKEIISLPPDVWDRYQNPFENKYTFRDKFKLPPLTLQLFQQLEDFRGELQKLSDSPLYLDPTRNFWGIHKFSSGDHLDIHLDASNHPDTNLKKKFTLGLYLTSSNWEKENGGSLELWEGDTKEIWSCKSSIEPKFNRMILFDNTDNSWHGSPTPIVCRDDQFRIFITMSYMTDLDPTTNKKKKAYFVPRPSECWTAEKLRLRDLRSEVLSCREVYNLETVK